MATTYRALAILLSYPTAETAALMPAVLETLLNEGLASPEMVNQLAPLAAELAQDDLYDVQARYVDLFDRSRSLSLQLYEHVHGESRDRGQAMVELLQLYSTHGLELTAKELPDHLPVFLEFLSTRPESEAASLLGQAAHVLEALRERLRKRGSIYAVVFDVLVAIVEADRNPSALQALLREPDDDPNDLAALDRAWADEQVTFGPDQVDCPKAALARARGSAHA